MTDSMDIYTTQPGDKVIFAYPMAGWPGDQLLVAKYLKEGGVYTVKNTEIFNWHTTVTLEEFPTQGFNSVHFRNVA